MPSFTKPYQEVAAKAQAEVHNAIPAAWKLSSAQLEIPEHTNVTDIPRTCGILTPAQIQITEQTATELLLKLAGGELSSVEVTEAFCMRAAIAHQLVRSPAVSSSSTLIRASDKLLDGFLPGRSHAYSCYSR